MSCIAAVKARRGFERQCGKQGLNANVVFSPCFVCYRPMNPFMANQMAGINKEGSMFKVLQSFSPKMPMPELAMSMPPMMEISVSSCGDKKADKKPAPR